MKGVQIAYDAKRAFANRRGLGNYSRDMILSRHRRLLRRTSMCYAVNRRHYVRSVPHRSCLPKVYGVVVPHYGAVTVV